MTEFTGFKIGEEGEVFVPTKKGRFRRVGVLSPRAQAMRRVSKKLDARKKKGWRGQSKRHSIASKKGKRKWLMMVLTRKNW